jgi:hypothetical protein
MRDITLHNVRVSGGGKIHFNGYDSDYTDCGHAGRRATDRLRHVHVLGESRRPDAGAGRDEFAIARGRGFDALRKSRRKASLHRARTSSSRFRSEGRASHCCRRKATAGPSTTIGAKYAPISAQDDSHEHQKEALAKCQDRNNWLSVSGDRRGGCGRPAAVHLQVVECVVDEARLESAGAWPMKRQVATT